MSETEKSDGGVRAVTRSLDILLAFTPDDYELSAAELLKRVDLSRPTLYRLLHTLQERGFIDATGEPQKFRLGRSVARLAHVWSSGLNLARVAQPFMEKLWEETGETVALFIRQGQFRLCISELPSPQPLSFKRGVGYSERIYKGASGRAILAAMQLSAQHLGEMTAGEGLDMEAFEKELELTRLRGYAYSHNELILGAVAVAAPFTDRAGYVSGSMAVFGPDTRINDTRVKELGERLIQATADLSRDIGGA